EFDAKQPVKFEKAVVTKMEWTNPHSWIHVEVTMPDGHKEAGAIEAGTASVLFRRGFTKDALLPGTAIVIDGYRAKDGSHRANGRNLTLPNGETLFLGSARAAAAERQGALPRLVGHRRARREAVILHTLMEWMADTPWSVGLHESRYAYS